jgi:predicted MFS family arabinose efflux permease
LLVFPQIVETAYSPALVDIATAFEVLPEVAGQTLAIYFAGFAAGVLVWGMACDRIGRRRSMLAGLGCYMAGVSMALVSNDFFDLMCARALAAFGAAAGSIVTQTLLRDHFHGQALSLAFARAGMALAVSPAIGAGAGAILAGMFGHRGVFIFLAVLAAVLLVWTLRELPRDTPPVTSSTARMSGLVLRMAGDARIRAASVAIALWNLQLFGFYEVAPFVLQGLDMPVSAMGWSGAALAAGAMGGATLNRRLLTRGWPPERLLLMAAALDSLGYLPMVASPDSIRSLFGMPLVAAAFAIAIPQILGSVLGDYASCRGSAGAVLGVSYYLLLALGLSLFGWAPSMPVAMGTTIAATLLASKLYQRAAYTRVAA